MAHYTIAPDPDPGQGPGPCSLYSSSSHFSQTRRSNRSTQSHSHYSLFSTPPSSRRPNFILRPPAAHLANPVNYVPRVTPVRASRSPRISDESLPLEAHRDAYPLLTLSEQRRNRLNQTPSSLVVERSQVESESGRTSIALPSGQRRSGTFEQQLASQDCETIMAKQSTGFNATKEVENNNNNNIRVPDQAHLAVDATGRLRHVPSQTSLHSQSQIASIPSNTGHSPVGGDADTAEELAWGPAHPCFPHINPHVPIDSKEYLTTRIIRIKRDWMIKGDLAPTFSNLYPEILDPLLPEQEFRRIIATVNDELIKAFDPFSFTNCIDSALGLLTGWLWEDLGATSIKRHLRRIEAWLEKWNKEVGAKEGVRIWSLRRTAYMSLDIQIPDPKVGIIHSEDASIAGTRPDTEIGRGA